MCVCVRVCVCVIAMWVISKYEMGVASGMYGGKREEYTGFWWGIMREKDHLEDPGVDGRIILKWVFRKWDVWAWTVSVWLRIGTGGGLF